MMIILVISLVVAGIFFVLVKVGSFFSALDEMEERLREEEDIEA